METTQTSRASATLNVLAYAREHRLRIRNLHDGGPVPPARKKGKSRKTGYIGAEDRMDAIVGHRGYVTAEDGGLGICLFFKSGRGVALAKSEITVLGGRVTQEGDCELAGWLPAGAIESALKLIRVSRLHPGNPNPPVLDEANRARIASTSGNEGKVGVNRFFGP